MLLRLCPSQRRCHRTRIFLSSPPGTEGDLAEPRRLPNQTLSVCRSVDSALRCSGRDGTQRHFYDCGLAEGPWSHEAKLFIPTRLFQSKKKTLSLSLCPSLARRGTLKPPRMKRETRGSKPSRARSLPACSHVRAARIR